MHWYVDERLTPDARRFTLSLTSITVEQWVAIKRTTMSPGSPYSDAIWDIMFRVMDVASRLSLHSELAVAQISAVDAVRSLDWAGAEVEPIDEDDFEVIENAKAAAESAAHNAAGVIVTLASMSSHQVAVAFSPFRGTSVELPG